MCYDSLLFVNAQVSEERSYPLIQGTVISVAQCVLIISEDIRVLDWLLSGKRGHTTFMSVIVNA